MAESNRTSNELVAPSKERQILPFEGGTHCFVPEAYAWELWERINLLTRYADDVRGDCQKFQAQIERLRAQRRAWLDDDLRGRALVKQEEEIERLRAALKEAMQWNWLEEDAKNTIPPEVWRQCEDAAAGVAVENDVSLYDVLIEAESYFRQQAKTFAGYRDEAWWTRLATAAAAEAAKALPAVETSGWRPIETAPKGGRWVLLAWPAVTDVPFVGYRQEGVWRAATNGDHWVDMQGPTHWMPLPAMPSKKANEGRL